MKTTEIRQKFLDYFNRHEHEIVASSPLIPGDDPTLLFTNAGMVQFKDTFLGLEQRDYVRAVTSQRCVRAGGKHNDLENVGYTARHHTFFEMLGNFSFGDYFKHDAIRFAWDLLTKELGLSADKLWVTVFEEDDEAERIWLEEIGVPADRVARIGAKDNFWAMGDTGPCGPCSEIFYDHGPDVAGGPPGTPEEDGDRFVEIWNLVFMQYNRDESGTLNPLPKPSVDTGMGLERIAAVLQGVHSNYEIDLFEHLINEAARVLGVEATHDNKSLLVIADHIRACSFLIVDGVTPSNEGRGYVLRRIARRAMRHGYQQGCRQPFMHKLVAGLVDEMGAAYPELAAAQATIERVLKKENIKFSETLEHGITILDDAFERLQGDQLPGDVVFKLYDTFGFPVDLTADYAREHGKQIDHEGFEVAMNQQRERARAVKKFSMDTQVSVDAPRTDFSGYEHLVGDSVIQALVVDGKSVAQIEPDTESMVVLGQTPFYAESGGQVGDRGVISVGEARFIVSDTQYLANKVVGHLGTLMAGQLKVGDDALAEVDAEARQSAAINHSGTHLLHAALKLVLGEHVQQKGSLVAPSRLRFDFSHFEPMTAEQMREVEAIVNAQIRGNVLVSTTQMALDEAKAKGAAALFGEKYDTTVRVVQMGDYSLELCGGTHVSRTGDIGLIKVISETGIASGVRRIEVATGQAAEAMVNRLLDSLQSAATQLKSAPDELATKIETLVTQQKSLEKQVKDLKAKLAMSGGSGGSNAVEEINGVKVLTIRQDDTDVAGMRATVDQAKSQVSDGLVAVGGAYEGKVTLIVAVGKQGPEWLHAGKIIQAVMPIVGGRGGGKAEMAQGGGSDVCSLDEALQAVKTEVANSA